MRDILHTHGIDACTAQQSTSIIALILLELLQDVSRFFIEGNEYRHGSIINQLKLLVDLLQRWHFLATELEYLLPVQCHFP